MDKDYLNDLRKWVEEKKGQNGKTANQARVVFLAIRDDVEAAINAGYNLTTIWEHMHETGRVSTTYETFRRHVKRFITERNARSVVASREATVTKAAVNVTEKNSSLANKAGPSSPTRGKQPAPSLPGFNFQPNKEGNA